MAWTIWSLYPKNTFSDSLISGFEAIEKNAPSNYWTELEFLNNWSTGGSMNMIPILRGSLALDLALELSNALEESTSTYFDYELKEGIRLFDARLTWHMGTPNQKNTEKFITDLAKWAGGRMIETWEHGISASEEKFVIIAPEEESLCKKFFEVLSYELFKLDWHKLLDVSTALHFKNRLMFRFVTVDQ